MYQRRGRAFHHEIARDETGRIEVASGARHELRFVVHPQSAVCEVPFGADLLGVLFRRGVDRPHLGAEGLDIIRE